MESCGGHAITMESCGGHPITIVMESCGGPSCEMITLSLGSARSPFSPCSILGADAQFALGSLALLILCPHGSDDPLASLRPPGRLEKGMSSVSPAI